ncbi:hypothetical protein [Nostoc sp.]
MSSGAAKNSGLGGLQVVSALLEKRINAQVYKKARYTWTIDF